MTHVGERVIVHPQVPDPSPIYTGKLNQDRELSQPSIGPESFLPALAAGALDSCLAYLDRADKVLDVTGKVFRKIAAPGFSQADALRRRPARVNIDA